MSTQPTANMDITQFDELGYVLVRDVIDSETVQSLRTLMLAEFEKHKTNVLPDAVLFYPQYIDLLERPKLRDALQTILGKPFVVPPHSSAEHHRFGLFHSDTTGAEMNGETFHKDPQFRMVTCAIYLQDNNEYGGGLRLVGSTHRQPDQYVELTRAKAEFRKTFRNSRARQIVKRLSRGRIFDWDRPFREHPEQIDVPTRAGDALIWDMRLYHMASPQRQATPPGQATKIAIFFTAGANNDITTVAYMKYVTSMPTNEFIAENRASVDVTVPRHTDDYIIL